ncbi:pentapeptide repeat-containing protein [Streptomyces sp. NPDC057301]|uniref:pentapeptide repeat-containing protein n=1 Tax=Streptomyces sp. NPDC057301 TaxID=3346093 RepID=UPI003644194D
MITLTHSVIDQLCHDKHCIVQQCVLGMAPMPNTHTGWALLGVLILLGILGATGAVFAWRMAVREPEREPRIEVLAGIGGGLITGIAIGVSALFLEQSLEKSQRYATWRANVEIAESIPGFTPGDRDIKGINFSGKALHNADLRGADLRDAQLRDTDLTGADLRGAQMHGANLIGANLYEADLRNTHLDRAQLESANFTHAIVDAEETSFDRAKVNSLTCWPIGIITEKLEGHVDEKGQQNDAFPWGQRVPDCTLWKDGERVR